MPKLKKQPKNAYAFFMQERRVQLEKLGYRFPNGLRDVSEVVQGEWTNLPPAERARFEKLAKEHKEKEKSNLDNKFTATGEAYSSLQRRMQAEETERIELQTLFRKYENTASGKVVHQLNPTEVIYIIMKAISSCEVGLPNGQGEKQVFPLELAMGSFNVKYGVICSYWTLIDTVTIPCGWASTAKETSEETLLPQPGSSVFEVECPQSRNYKAILTNIRKYIETWLDGYPSNKFMIFAMNQDIPTIKGSLDWLVKNYDGPDKESNEDFFDALKFYSLPDLVIELSRLANKLNPSFITEIVQFKLPGSAEKLLNHGNYDYKDEITCPYHKKEEYSQKMHLCCKNVVLRRIFLILEEVAENGFNCPFTDRHRISTFFNAKLADHLAKKIPKPSRAPSVASASVPSSSHYNSSTSDVKSRDGNSSSGSSRNSGVKRDRSPPYDDNIIPPRSHREKSPEYAPKWGSSSSSSSRFKKQEASPMEDDFPPLVLTTTTSTSSRGRGYRQPEESKPKPIDLEEGETISDDDDDDDDTKLHRSLNTGSSNGSSGGRGAGRGRAVAHSAYGKW